MPTEEELPGNTDEQQEQKEQPAAEPTESTETPEETKPASETIVKQEEKCDTAKAEQPPEEDSKPARTEVKTEPATATDKATDDSSKPDVDHSVDSGSVSEHVKTESLPEVIKPDSSPQQQEQTTSVPCADAAGTAEKPSTPVPPGRAEEEEEEEEDDDEEPGDNEEQEEQPSQQQSQQHSSSKQRSDESYNNDEEPGHNAAQQRQDQSQTPTGAQYYEDDEEDDEEEGEEQSELRQLFEPINDSQALSEDEEDGDYIPDEEVKKTIMVGSDFQAVIPEGLCRYDDALPYENEDKLLWNPTILNEQEIEEYLVKITSPAGGLGTAGGGGGGGATGTGGQQKGATGSAGTATSDPQSNSVYAIPLGNHLRDDEQSLYLLQQCGHNVDEALRRKRISNNAVPVPEQQMSIWSEEECRNFENGLRVHGKDFHMIQQTKVRTRSVGELVQFYYLWKKTERHDLFASKARLEKKKYNLHPGLTDHMDRFLEEQENSTGFGDRSSSPGFNSLYNSASEAKRQRLLDSKENNTASAKRSASNL